MDEGVRQQGKMVIDIEVPEKLDSQIRSTIVQPTLTQLKSMGIDYRGALFIDLMIKNS